MACNVAFPAPSSTNSLFDDDWKNCGGDFNDLCAIAAFNDNFDDHNFDLNTTQGGPGGSVDPQILNNTPSPTSTHTAFDSYNHGPLDTSMFDLYPPPPNTSNGAPPGLPYFSHPFDQHHPIMHERPFAQPSPLRNYVHRRSVSEPPDQHHLWPPQQQEMMPMPTFTRQGTPLGTPRQQGSRAVARTKQPLYRQQFSVVKRQGARQERYQLRRTQTQPAPRDGGPTSVPQAVMQSPPVPQMMAQQANMMMMPPAPQQREVSSRVCTPAPEPELGAAGNEVDPRLASPSMGNQTQGGVMVSLSVDELRAMIKEAVSEAVKAAVAEFASNNEPAFDGQEQAEAKKADELPGAGDGDEDTIQVANGMEGVRNSIEIHDGLF